MEIEYATNCRQTVAQYDLSSPLKGSNKLPISAMTALSREFLMSFIEIFRLVINLVANAVYAAAVLQ